MHSDVIVIGSGLAGYSVAREWRKLQPEASIRMITAEDGAFYSKPLLSTAMAHQKNPETLMLGKAEGMSAQIKGPVMTHTPVTAIDTAANTVTVASGEIFSYTTLVLAMGSSPIPLPEVKDAFYPYSRESYAALRAALTPGMPVNIIGSGLVGCEFAHDLQSGGHSVAVFGMDAHPLARFLPPEIGQALQAAMAAHGVTWHLGVQSPMAHPAWNLKACTVVAIGAAPNIALVKGQVETAKGILVDAHLRTSVPNVYALGDCAEVRGYGWMPYIAPILSQARALAQNLVGNVTEFVPNVFPVVVKTPSFPLCCFAPAVGVAGQWQVQQVNEGWVGEYLDTTGQLQGFVLSGKNTQDKQSYLERLFLNR